MKIAILGGTGALGLGLASRWIRSGHEVLIGSRTIESAKSACEKLNINEDQGMLNVDAANQAEISCLTVPFSFQLDILSEVKDALSGKILIDGTVQFHQLIFSLKVHPSLLTKYLIEMKMALLNTKFLPGLQHLH